MYFTKTLKYIGIRFWLRKRRRTSNKMKSMVSTSVIILSFCANYIFCCSTNKGTISFYLLFSISKIRHINALKDFIISF